MTPLDPSLSQVRATRRRLKTLETEITELKSTLRSVLHTLDTLRRRKFRLPDKDSPAARKKAQVEQMAQVLLRPRGKPAALAPTGWAGALVRGEAARVNWVRTGEVVAAQILAAHWDLTPQALGPAARRGDVFAIVVKRQRYYPCEFLELQRDDVAAVCKALGPLSADEKLVFWKRAHGALAGRTVTEQLRSKDPAALTRVVRLARARAAQAEAHAAAAA